MAIVLPGKKRKKTDIFAPSQAIQDAKEKIGPAFFDISLLECSRNAIELTKLVARWDELEKEKTKILRDINREEDVLLRSLKTHKTNSKDKKSNNKARSIEGIETLDGKIVPPGFRFTSNGEIKASTLSLPIVNAEEILKIETIGEVNNDDPARITNAKNQSQKLITDWDSNYEREVFEIESVIKTIYKNLSKVSFGAQRLPSSEKGNAYLRAHKNDYISKDNVYRQQDYKSPNDRFAFKPGSSSKLHKNGVKIPTYRTCIGCKFKLKCDAEESAKPMKKTQSEELKRRWSYVPRGKYVQSSCTLAYKSSLQAGDQLLIKDKQLTKSAVHFETPRVDLPQRAMSVQIYKMRSTGNGNSLKNILGARNAKSAINTQWSSPSDHSKQSLSTPPSHGRRISSTSGLSRRSGSRISAHLVVDHESRMQTLKKFQEEEQNSCDEKVKTFLRKLDPGHDKKHPDHDKKHSIH